MPATIKHFAQVVQLCPELWSCPDQIRSQFEHEGHRSSFITTIVAYVLALHNILISGACGWWTVGSAAYICAPSTSCTPSRHTRLPSIRISRGAWPRGNDSWRNLPKTCRHPLTTGGSNGCCWENQVLASHRSSSGAFTMPSSRSIKSSLQHQWHSLRRATAPPLARTWTLTPSTQLHLEQI